VRFEAFEVRAHEVEVAYYLIAILFILSTWRRVSFFRWAGGASRHRRFRFWSMMVFLGILVIGFVYDGRREPLEWE